MFAGVGGRVVASLAASSDYSSWNFEEEMTEICDVEEGIVFQQVTKSCGFGRGRLLPIEKGLSWLTNAK